MKITTGKAFSGWYRIGDKWRFCLAGHDTRIACKTPSLPRLAWKAAAWITLAAGVVAAIVWRWN